MPADPQAVRRYQESQILTAPREQLLLMLFDGAIRFSEQGRQHLSEKKIEEGIQALIRAQHIMLELTSALDRQVGEALYQNLTGLYGFVYLRLVRAGVEMDVAAVEDALAVLRRLREMWGEAVEQMRRERIPEARVLEEARRPQTPPAAAPSAPPAGWSVKG